MTSYWYRTCKSFWATSS